MTKSEIRYREWLGVRIQLETGTLTGVHKGLYSKGLYSLDTPSLEKLYFVLSKKDPKREYTKWYEYTKTNFPDPVR